MNQVKVNLNWKFVYLVNEDLKMSPGKIAAQVSHVAMQLGADFAKVNEGYATATIGKAIVLKAPESLLKSIISKLGASVSYVEDAGMTEVPAGSLTCVGFMESKLTISFTKGLKLL